MLREGGIAEFTRQYNASIRKPFLIGFNLTFT